MRSKEEQNYDLREENKIVLSEEATEEYNALNRIVGDELQRGISSSASIHLSFC